MRLYKKILFGLGFLLIAIQFFRPDRTNPPEYQTDTVYATLSVPADVRNIFETACIDCHSNRSEWPWYTEISPISWFVVEHIVEGRDELDLSNWRKYSPTRSEHKLEELCEKVEEGEMPLKSYVLIHWDARLSQQDKDLLCAWSNSERDAIRAANPAAFVDEDDD